MLLAEDSQEELAEALNQRLDTALEAARDQRAPTQRRPEEPPHQKHRQRREENVLVDQVARGDCGVGHIGVEMLDNGVRDGSLLVQGTLRQEIPEVLEFGRTRPMAAPVTALGARALGGMRNFGRRARFGRWMILWECVLSHVPLSVGRFALAGRGAGRGVRGVPGGARRPFRQPSSRRLRGTLPKTAC